MTSVTNVDVYPTVSGPGLARPRPRPLQCFVPDFLTPASLLRPFISSSSGEFRLTSPSHLSRGLPTGLLPWNFHPVLFYVFQNFFNICHPEVFNTYVKYTMMYQSNTTNLYYVFIVLGQHVSILIESSSGPSK